MATIVNYYNGDKAIQFQQEQIANTLSIGTNWTHVRLGFLYQLSMSITQTASIPTPAWSYGLCSGTASLIGSAAGPTYFVGVKVANTASYVKSSDLRNTPYWWGSDTNAEARLFTQVGTTNITASAQTLQRGAPSIPCTLTGSQAFVQYQFPIYVDFIKAANVMSPQLMNIRYYNHSPDNGIRPLRSASINEFYQYLASITASSFDDPIWWHVGVTSLAISESTYGALDSVCWHWPVNQPFMISEIAVYRYA